MYAFPLFYYSTDSWNKVISGTRQQAISVVKKVRQLLKSDDLMVGNKQLYLI